MSDGISGISFLTQNQQSTESNSRTKELGRDQFLTMLLAQLKHQDPLNPMEGQEFSAQLAQFSSLEQLFNMNENLEAMKSAQDQNARFYALDLIGKEIEADGDSLSWQQGKTAKGGFTIDERAHCTALISDASGAYVRSIDLGLLEPGQHTVEWDGLNDTGTLQEEGTYLFEVRAVSESGIFLPAATRITGQVTRVNMAGDQPILYVDDVPVYLAQVIDIRAPEASSESDSGVAEDSEDTD